MAKESKANVTNYQGSDNIVTPKDLVKLIVRAYRTRHPVYVSGPPGIGKTAIAKSCFDAINEYYQDPKNPDAPPKLVNLCVVHAPVWEPQDIKGIPMPGIAYKVIDGEEVPYNVTEFAVPKNFPAGPTLFVIDEIANAPRATQAALQRLILERTLDNGYEADKDSYFTALSNRIADKAGAGALLTSLDNRFIHVSLQTNKDDFVDWLLDTYSDEPHRLKAASYIAGYLQYRPSDLFQFDSKNTFNDVHGFPTPRTFQFVTDVIADAILTNEDLGDFITKSLIKGAVGVQTGTVLAAFIEMSKTIPSVMAILDGKGPVTIDLSKPDVAILTISGIGSMCQEKYFDRIFEVAQFLRENGKSDYGSFLMKIASRVNNEIAFDKKNKCANKNWIAHAAAGGGCDITL